MFTAFKAKNTSTEEAKKLSYVLFLCMDVSGSMGNQDAYDRKTGKANISRLEAAKNDAVEYMTQLSRVDRLAGCFLCLFGEKVTVHDNVRNPAELEKIFSNVRTEGATRTDLVIKESNKYFLEHMKKYTDAATRPAFFTLIQTDGSPTGGGSEEEMKNNIAQLLVQGTDPMTRDEDRVTLFLQYGSSEYKDTSAVSQFLAFLDDNLQELSEEYFKIHYKDQPERCQNLYDACDTGKQFTSWKEKDPENKMKLSEADRSKPWDTNIEKMFEIAICD